MITIRTFSDHKEFGPIKGCYRASSLKETIFHIRLAMADGEHLVGSFNEDHTCYGLWETMGDGGYLLRRPGGPMAGHFNSLARLLR